MRATCGESGVEVEHFFFGQHVWGALNVNLLHTNMLMEAPIT